MKSLATQLDNRQAKGLYRKRRLVQSAQGIELTIDGKRLLSFCSNDYLGLANHPDVVESFQKGAATWGFGSGAAHLVCGHMQPHHELEEALAAFVHRPCALLFSTGYMANLGVVSALLGRGDAVLQDRLNHASLIDAGLASDAKFWRYPHGDVAALDSYLKQLDARQTMVLTDAVFSMDGDLAPLPALAKVCQRHGAWLMVDDAHGIGVLGGSGAGCLQHFDLSVTDVPILMGTLGKALGGFGAFVAGDDELIEMLIQAARSYVYTTALPPAVAQALCTSLHVLQQEPWRREHLQALIQYFRAGAAELGLHLPHSTTAIQPIMIGDTQQAVRVSEQLYAKGIFITAIRPPTVPVGSARLRVTFSCDHQFSHVDRLLAALQEVLA